MKRRGAEYDRRDPMKRMLSVFAFALPLALLLAAAVTPASAQGEAGSGVSAKASDEGKVQIFKNGDNFVAVIFRSDGSATVAVVDYRPPKAAGKPNTKPDIDDLMRNGKVTYTVRLTQKEMTVRKAAEANAAKPGSKAVDAKARTTLTRQQKSDLLKQIRQSTRALDTVGKGVGEGDRVGTATLSAKRVP